MRTPIGGDRGQPPDAGLAQPPSRGVRLHVGDPIANPRGNRALTLAMGCSRQQTIGFSSAADLPIPKRRPTTIEPRRQPAHHSHMEAVTTTDTDEHE